MGEQKQLESLHAQNQRQTKALHNELQRREKALLEGSLARPAKKWANDVVHIEHVGQARAMRPDLTLPDQDLASGCVSAADPDLSQQSPSTESKRPQTTDNVGPPLARLSGQQGLLPALPLLTLGFGLYLLGGSHRRHRIEQPWTVALHRTLLLQAATGAGLLRLRRLGLQQIRRVGLTPSLIFRTDAAGPVQHDWGQ